MCATCFNPEYPLGIAPREERNEVSIQRPRWLFEDAAGGFYDASSSIQRLTLNVRRSIVFKQDIVISSKLTVVEPSHLYFD